MDSANAAEWTASYKLNADDYRKFQLFHGRKQLIALFVFYWLLFVIAVYWNGGFDRPLSLLWIVPLGLVVSGLLLGLHRWSVATKTSKLFASDRIAQLEQRLSVSEEGIRHSTGEHGMELKWEQLNKVVESKDALLIYVARNKVLLLPTGDRDVSELKARLRRHVPGSKLRLRD